MRRGCGLGEGWKCPVSLLATCCGSKLLKVILIDSDFGYLPSPESPGHAVMVYYESIKRELKIKPIYECRCDGRLQTKRFTRLSYTGLVVELEHLKISLGVPVPREKFALTLHTRKLLS